MCTDQPATDMQPKALFATNDGGATWQLKSDACLAFANGQVIRNIGSLECVGYLPTLSFLSDGHGLMYAGRTHMDCGEFMGAMTWPQPRADGGVDG
jgi:hypothetical protein